MFNRGRCHERRFQLQLEGEDSPFAGVCLFPSLGKRGERALVSAVYEGQERMGRIPLHHAAVDSGQWLNLPSEPILQKTPTFCFSRQLMNSILFKSLTTKFTNYMTYINLVTTFLYAIFFRCHCSNYKRPSLNIVLLDLYPYFGELLLMNACLHRISRRKCTSLPLTANFFTYISKPITILPFSQACHAQVKIFLDGCSRCHNGNFDVCFPIPPFFLDLLAPSAFTPHPPPCPH